MNSAMESNDEDNLLASLAANYVNTTHRHIFLTGKAGTGKTTFLRKIASTSFKKCVIAAPTGIAAINAGGVTLHSLLQLPFGTFVPDEMYVNSSFDNQRVNTPRSVLSNMKINTSKRKLLRELDLLIIDEVSMLRADTLDCMDTVLKSIRRSQAPFGGLQLLFIGDLLQLPPVVKDDEKPLIDRYYPSSYFFESHALKNSPPIYIELERIYRQSDQEFIDILNNLRNNQLTSDDLLVLNRHFQEYYELDNTIFITTHNYKADKINQTKLHDIHNELYTYTAVIEDDFPETMYPATFQLQLKEGAQVIFIKNDPTGEQRFFNGKIGEVVELHEDQILVNCDGQTIELEQFVWENKRFHLNPGQDEVEEQTIGTFKQFPVKLAWAITVHKSQGLTFENAVIDVSGAFAPGQIYVALSRLTSLEGLTLTAPIPDDILGSEASVLRFTETKPSKDILQEGLLAEQKSFLKGVAMSSFDFQPLHRELHQHFRDFDKEKKKTAKQQYREWTQKLISDTVDLEEVARKFRKQLANYNEQDSDFIQLLIERVTKAETFFTPRIQDIVKGINSHLEDLKVKNRVTKYRKEVLALKEAFQKKQFEIDKSKVILTAIKEGNEPKKDQLKSLLPKPTSQTSSVKINTVEVSFDLYEEGLSIEEIAEKRNLSPGTIETHLSKYVESGKIEVQKFVEQEKLENILKVMEVVNTTQLGPIKSKLGDEYTYGDIKFVVAFVKSNAPANS